MQDMDATTQIARLQEFLSTLFHPELLERIRTGKNRLTINFDELALFDPELAEYLLEEPENFLKACEIAVEQLEGKKGFIIRFANLPTSQTMDIRNLRSEHLTKFIQVQGTVRQKTDVRPQITSARFECPSCGNIISIHQVDTKFREPDRCSCGRKGRFRLLSKELVDAQKIVLEESPDDLDGGDQPKRINIFLRRDLVAPITDRRTNPGSKVVCTGYLKEVPILLPQGGQSTRYEIMLESNHIAPVEEDYSQINISPEEKEEILELSQRPNIYQQLINSLAPTVYGHDRIKEAIVLQMLGGVKKMRADGASVRGDLHVLLVGDPGSGKTQLLKRSQQVAPKSRFVSGKGASGAGLTASVVRDEVMRGWALEAGALPLANKGFCLTKNTLISTPRGEQPIHEVYNAVLRSEKPALLSLDYNSLQTKQDIVRAVSKRKSPVKKIALSNGDFLEITDEHPVLVWDNGYSWVPAGNLSEGDCIITKQSLPLPKQYPLLANLLSDDVFVYFDVKQILENTSITQMCSLLNIPRHRTFPGNKIQIGDIKKLCSQTATPFDSVSSEISIPNVPARASAQLGLFAGLVLSDGHLSKNKHLITFYNTESELIDLFCSLAYRLFGKQPSIHTRGNAKQAYFSSPSVHKLLQSLGIARGDKSKTDMDFTALMQMPAAFRQAFFCGLVNGDGSITARKSGGIVSVVGGSRRTLDQIRRLIRPLGILARVSAYKAFGGGVVKKGETELYRLTVTGVSNLQRIASQYLMKRKKDDLLRCLERKDLAWKIPHTKKLYKSLNKQIPHNEKKVLYSNGLKISQLDSFAVSHEVFERTTRELAQMNPAKYTDEIKLFQKILDEDMVFLRVQSIEPLGVQTVYNIQMSSLEHPNFFANNICTHNCMIDELDKMSQEDRSAFHEALESQTVTISKANIQATLRCETVVLAAANPKFGRFDPYELLAKQIELPSTLINRFDLIFPVRDLPGVEKDTQMADFILRLHQTGDIENTPIETKLLTKYIAYARGRVFPQLTDEAIKEIQKFYVDMRNTGNDGEGISAIPISARQLEALVRLSEASARSRLATVVTQDDARRAIDLVMYCLQQLGVDPDTGKLDIDRLTTGVTASTRSQVHIIKAAIKELAEMTGDPLVAEEEILQKAAEQGITEEKAEEILEKLNRLGDIFRPKPGYYSMMK